MSDLEKIVRVCVCVSVFYGLCVLWYAFVCVMCVQEQDCSLCLLCHRNIVVHTDNEV